MNRWPRLLPILFLLLAARTGALPVRVEPDAGAPEPGTEATTNALPESPAVSTGAPPVEVETPAVTNAVSPPVVEPEAEPRPARRGAELSQAFKNSRASKFGLSSKQRSLKIPGKADRPKREKTDWRRTLEVGANTTSGNTDTRRMDASITAQKETELLFFWFGVGGRFGETDGENDTENAEIEGRVERGLGERTYAALDANVFHDQIADLSYRARGNVSLGRFLVISERTLIGVEAGPGYVREKKGGTVDGFAAGRAVQYAERVLFANLRAWESVDGTLNLEDTDVFFLTAELGVEIVLSPAMSLMFSLEDRYDSVPAEDKEANDLVTRTTVKWTF